jgi:hypothetical protein
MSAGGGYSPADDSTVTSISITTGQARTDKTIESGRHRRSGNPSLPSKYRHRHGLRFDRKQEDKGSELKIT